MAPTSLSELQQKLYSRIGISSTPSRLATGVRSQNATRQQLRGSRKETRRQKRVEKKSRVNSRAKRHGSHNESFDRPLRVSKAKESSTTESGPGQHDLTPMSESETDHSDSEEDHARDSSKHRDGTSQMTGDSSHDSRHRKQLAADDAEIEEFERKLGIKKGRKSLPQAFKYDGLGDLLDNIDDAVLSDENEHQKRKIDYDNWLSSKRQKVAPAQVKPSRRKQKQDVLWDSGTDVETDEPNKEYDLESAASEIDDEESDVLSEDLDSEGDDSSRASLDADEQPTPSKRENPYVAPVGGTNVVKYVPPSRRQQDEKSSQKDRSHLQKRVQGLINRLTDANLLSIVRLVEEMCQSNARGEVTEILVETILSQMRKPESLTDQFFVLVAGFSAAVYKIIGPSFGSHLVHHVIQDFSEHYDMASGGPRDQSAIRKEPANFLSFLTELYVFEVIGCNIVFDYMERLLSDLSEINVELLLRVCRMAGRLLRRDDPRALKHVSSVLNESVAKIGYSNVSARTKFMIETIQGLQNSKTKSRGTDSAVVSEHVSRMKKHLGELKSQSRRLDGLAPMGIRLKDVESMDKQGKWWLVGASVPEYRRATERAEAVFEVVKTKGADKSDEEDMDFVLPDYPKKARAQGLNTMVQVAIFTAIMSALDHEHGYRQFLNLKLKKDEQLEVARVLVQCVGSEQQYNEYYALVGKQACASSRIRFSFQDRIWRVFRGLGESLFGEVAEEEHTVEGEKMRNERRLSHVAQFYASLVADGALSINLLKPLKLPEMNSWTSLFVERFLLNLLRGCGGRSTDHEAKIERIFGPARDVPSVAAGLHWFLRKKMAKSKHIGKAKRREMQRLIDEVQTAVQGSIVDE
ncbi:nuclear protein [Moelleriella libera RCEF 2490]|uniref:Nuclear protein n=1 Tax=Moelleriella libera RCEF 2490 TaxID=1081109 RepID=A0A168A3T9_9HYPO|nr:nuclear protein [Moelleriella libera RCEF 2490]